MMRFDYSKLRGKIAEVCVTRKAFAKELGISAPALANRMTNANRFSQDEIAKAVDILHLSPDEVLECFFTVIVQDD